MESVLAGLDARCYQVHALHHSGRNWPETNCYTDLWIEVLHAAGLPPEACLGFTARQDFEGDQFTFFKAPLDDIERLFDIRVTELAIFDELEQHVRVQIGRGRLTLVEVDSFYLPDTRGVSYRTSHGKTTIGINGLDPASRRMAYFHNAGYFELSGEDYDGVFGRQQATDAYQQLFPYVEFAKFPERRHMPSAADCERILAWHVSRRPHSNPFTAWQKALPAHIDDLMQRPDHYFHTYAFNTLRQAGANFDLLASHLEWLGQITSNSYVTEIEAARMISVSAKSMQFQLARAIARRRTQDFETLVMPIAESYDLLMSRLESRIGARLAA